MSTLARFTGLPNKDNTSRIITNDFQQPAFVTPLALVITKAKTLVQPAQLTGIVTITANVGDDAADDLQPFVGDEVEFLLQSDGTSRVVTFGTGFTPNGTLSVTTGKFGYIKFMFYCATWQETNRTVTA